MWFSPWRRILRRKSGDTKPSGLKAGTKFVEEDTGVEYTYDPVMQDWKKKVAPYSAIVCKDGSTVWAENSDGGTIASGEDAGKVIQAAIDYFYQEVSPGLQPRIEIYIKDNIGQPYNPEVSEHSELKPGLDTTVKIPSFCSIVSRHAKIYGDANPMFYMINPDGSRPEEASIKGLWIFSKRGRSGTNDLIRLHTGRRCSVEDCYLGYTAGNAIYCEGAWGTRLERLHLIEVGDYANDKHAIYLADDGTYGSNNLIIHDIYFGDLHGCFVKANNPNGGVAPAYFTIDLAMTETGIKSGISGFPLIWLTTGDRVSLSRFRFHSVKLADPVIWIQYARHLSLEDLYIFMAKGIADEGNRGIWINDCIYDLNVADVYISSIGDNRLYFREMDRGRISNCHFYSRDGRTIISVADDAAVSISNSFFKTINDSYDMSLSSPGSGKVSLANVKHGGGGVELSSSYPFVVDADDGSLGLGLYESQSTDASGQIAITFGGGAIKYARRPNIHVIVEGAYQWYVAGWSTDANGNYTGVTIQITDSGGTAVGSGVTAHIFAGC